ncbi:hypothetical protein [Auraticoccus monumenti]|uniref:hypothetical protein n=1 Tax=Auraticoccus monumenti TaxID=675864 RepID=UPI0012FC8619|nr:hypothetical protein [Auraticoccus monumenti]
MPNKKQQRFGNPARQAEVEARRQARAVAAQAVAVSAAAQRKTDSGCGSCCD